MTEETLQHEEWICKRLSDWLDKNPRRTANTAFTAGPVRELARKIEALLEK